MKPPYEITSQIVSLCSEISELIGMIKAQHSDVVKPKLRKENKIKTIHNTLKIEGNTLSEEQISTILDNKAVWGTQNEITEVINANKLYESINQYSAHSEKDFLNAHKILMSGLIPQSGKYRTSSVGIAKGEELQHIAPPHQNVKFLIRDLFNYIKSNEDHSFIKSCVAHYEIEFIHPFSDGNGRMGRFWQTLILSEYNQIFKSIPFESIVSQKQDEYYKVLSKCDKKGSSTLFIAFMLKILKEALSNYIDKTQKPLSAKDRLTYFTQSRKHDFTRKDYLAVFSDISTATASRDLALGVKMNLFKKTGTKNQTIYQLIF